MARPCAALYIAEKRHMKHTLPLLALLATTGISAQPVFTAANTTPVFGPTDISHATQYVAPGPATANFNFNVGTLTMGAGSSGTVVAPSSTPYASSFPNATFAATPGFGFYTFTSVSPTAVNYWGFAFDDEDLYANTDPEINIRLPCSMGTTWTDPFNGTGLSTAETLVRSGTVTGHYNGYGTLVLPFGTFTNVARIQLDEDYSDNYAGSIYHYVTNVVSYLIPGHTLFTSTTINTTVDGGSPQSSNSSSVIDMASVGIDELAPSAFSMKVFPNPASDEFSILRNGAGTADVTVTLMDATGREMLRLAPRNGVSNGAVMTFDISSVPRGMYIVRVADPQGRTSNTPLVLN